MTQRLATALGYAQRGWAVFPLVPNDKRPRFPKNHKWGDGFKSATTDTATILEMWQEGGSECNIGIATGQVSDLFVVDVDIKDGAVGAESEKALLATLRIERWPNFTLQVVTPSGGWHIYFRYPEDEELGSGASSLDVNIDTRGNGGYVVAPGSTVDGVNYEWRSNEQYYWATTPLADLPTGIIERLRTKAAAKATVTVQGTRPDDITDTILIYNREAAMRALDTMTGKVADAVDGTKHATCHMAGLVMGSWDHDGILPDSEAVVMHLLDAVRDRAKDVRAAEKAIRDGIATGRQNEKWAPARPSELFFIPFEDKATIIVNGRQDIDIYNETRDAIVKLNSPPILFNHGGELAVVEYNQLVHLKPASMPIVSGEFCKFMRLPAKGELTNTHAPPASMGHLFAISAPRFPPIDRVASSPFFMANGRYVAEPGYDTESRTYYFGTEDVTAPSVTPTVHEVIAARQFVMDEMLGDFIFSTNGDRATCLAMMLQPLVRSMIDGPTPLYSIEASTPGTGKSLLAQVALASTVGTNRLVMSAAATEEDWRKELLAALLGAPEAVVIDNVKDTMGSAALCMALTEPEYSQRILGVSQTATIPVRCVWAMTANNPSFSVDMARRMVRIGLDSVGDHPENRDGFRHNNLEVWVRQHRLDILHALSTMVSGWVAAGRPRGKQIMGRYEEWAQVMGGITDWLGVPGFLTHRAETAESEEHEAWQHFVELWRQKTGDGQGMRVGELRQIAMQTDLGLEIKGHTEQAMDTNFGYMMRRMRGRTLNGWQIQRRSGVTYTSWLLSERIKASEVNAPHG